MNTKRIRSGYYLTHLNGKTYEIERGDPEWTIERGWFVRDLSAIDCELSQAFPTLRAALEWLEITQPENTQPEKENFTMTAHRSYINTILCSVRIVDSAMGKADIVDYGNDPVMAQNIQDKGNRFTSKDLQGYSVGSIVRCEIEITGKGTRKVRSHTVANMGMDTHVVTDGSTVDTVLPSQSLSDDVVSGDTASACQNVQDVQNNVSVDVLTWDDPDYYVSPEARKVFQNAHNMLVRYGKSVKVLMTGGSGYGKTTLAEKIANLFGMEYVRINCATMRDETDWFGYAEVENDNGTSVTTFHDTQFSRALERGNCVIVLDEFNRVSPNLHNSLFPLLDDAQSTEVHNRVYTVGSNTVFVATINQGYEYNGTQDIDAAMINRFDYVLEIGAMPDAYEIPLLVNRTDSTDYDAMEIVRVANYLREYGYSCSTRTTLLIAKMVVCGMTIREAFEFSVTKRIPPTQEYVTIRKNIVDILNVQLDTLK